MAPDLAAIIDKFPETFGLRAFAGDVFRISHYHSFISCRSGVQLYTERRQEDGTWRSFAKGTPDELWRELVHLEEERAPWQVGRTRWGSASTRSRRSRASSRSRNSARQRVEATPSSSLGEQSCTLQDPALRGPSTGGPHE